MPTVLAAIPRRSENQFAYIVAGGMLTFGLTGGDASVTTTATEPIDLLELANLYGVYHAASLQVAPETTALASIIVSVEASNDGRNWSVISGATVGPGSGMKFGIDVTGVRFIRARVTTVEGAETVAIYVTLTRGVAA